MADQLYPHVAITVKALQRRHATTAASTATKMLMPFISERGPGGVIQEFNSLTDLKAEYGDMSYKAIGQEQILNAGQCFTGGGTVMALRVIDTTAKVSTFGKTNQIAAFPKYKFDSATGDIVADGNDYYYAIVTAECKYEGEYYNDIRLSIEVTTAGLYNISVYYGTTSASLSKVEYKRNVKHSEIYKYVNASDYIGALEINFYSDPGCATKVEYDTVLASLKHLGSSVDAHLNAEVYSGSTVTDNTDANDNMKFVGGSDGSLKVGSATMPYFEAAMIRSMDEAMKSPLETPCDYFVDIGYSEYCKKALIGYFCSESKGTYKIGTSESSPTVTVKNPRPDIFLVLTRFVKTPGTGKMDTGTGEVTSLPRVSEYDNIAVYTQYGKVSDSYSSSGLDDEVEIGLPYFVASFIPYIDNNYGSQYSLAGKNRTLISPDDLLWINEIPTASEKNTYYNDSVNYLEKDQDGYALMTELTYTSDDTTLKFIAHERTLLKIKQKLTVMGRSYLHEHNDSVTKKNMSNVLNGYLDTWINNRTLSEGSVELYDSNDDSSLENEEILIALTLKFTNYVEIITAEILCE